MMKYGVSYYPEHKTREEIEADITLLQQSGMNVVRMGEFAWCRLEPAEGQFEFEWLDDVVEKCGKQGILSILCTPTACPPAWLAEKHPEILYEDNRGVVRPFGGRRHYCYNNPVYREYSEKIAGAIGKHYSRNPYVLAFQIDNEPAQEGTGRCHCKVCGSKFQQWLGNRYGDIGTLNREWGTIFWSQEYQHFGQIPLPVNSIEVAAKQQIEAFYENPSLRLEFERFCSESQIEYQNIQTHILKKQLGNSGKPVTTNGTGLATNSINYFQSFRELDVYAYDFYPSLRDLEISSFSYSFARGVRNGNFWLLEFVSGGGHRLSGSGRLQPYPGAMKQAVLHAFASGAELLAHFQFKTFPFGAEQLNYAIIDLDGVPRRRYFEARETAAVLKKLDNILDATRFDNPVAVCFDYDSLWACKIKPVNAETFDYLNFCTEIYEKFVQLGVGADVISFDHALEKYKFVVVPAPFVMNQAFKSKLKKYVNQGGVVLTTFLAAAKNEMNTGLAESLPCGLTDLFGITVGEVEPVFPSTVADIVLETGRGVSTGTNKYWTEVLEPRGAKLIGTYGGGFRQKEGVVSRNQYGRGKAYYMGTGLEEELLGLLLSSIVNEKGIRKAPFRLEKGVEVVERLQSDDSSVYFIFNFLKRDVSIRLHREYENLLDGSIVGKEIVLEPKGVAVLVPKEI